MKKCRFTLIELICVMTILSILVGGGGFLITDLVKSANVFSQVVEDSMDTNFGLMRLSKELNLYSPGLTIDATGFTLSNTNANVNVVYWDSTTKKLLTDGNVLLDNVTNFKVTKDADLVTLLLEVNSYNPVTTIVMIRD